MLSFNRILELPMISLSKDQVRMTTSSEIIHHNTISLKGYYMVLLVGLRFILVTSPILILLSLSLPHLKASKFVTIHYTQ